ncbi:MAG: hypothetical protein JWO85_3665 [Candidatus Eremiobacteraeota bacterium]|nr:hypothetical protein [Candidatus Eremiobacteraeota bacterium]
MNAFDAVLGDEPLVTRISRERVRDLALILLRAGAPLGGYERKGADDIRNGDIDAVEWYLKQAKIPFEKHNEAIQRRPVVESFEGAAL